MIKTIIPTRRIISISKLFCLENIIRGGFILYQLYSSYGLYGFLLSKIYHRRISPVTLETSVRVVCMYYSTTTSLFQSILKKYGPQYFSWGLTYVHLLAGSKKYISERFSGLFSRNASTSEAVSICAFLIRNAWSE